MNMPYGAKQNVPSRKELDDGGPLRSDDMVLDG